MKYRTLQRKRANAAWWVLGAILLVGLVWAVPAQGITVDGVIDPGEWTGANVVIYDPKDVPDADYDLEHIKLADGNNSLYVSITVRGDKIALAAGDYLNFYFNLYSGGGQSYRFGLTHNDGYGFGSGEMHVVQYYDTGMRWEDLGEPEYAIDEAVEVRIPWTMLPAELTSGGAIAVQCLFFLYNVAPGDANNDGWVDIEDFGILRNNFGLPGVGWAEGNFNLDGQVDLRDFFILKSHYGYHAPDGSLHDIFDEYTEVQRNLPLTKHTPEPLTMLGVFMGIAGLAGYVRKRKLA
ncbi:MAG: PEP-CTERM sorting domain-containing protein [Phycisphaerae bacterium]|nr:PEP-CTERM sorting domain-containing protein [Phycisphaerae bacterium]